MKMDEGIKQSVREIDSLVSNLIKEVKNQRNRISVLEVQIQDHISKYISVRDKIDSEYMKNRESAMRLVRLWMAITAIFTVVSVWLSGRM